MDKYEEIAHAMIDIISHYPDDSQLAKNLAGFLRKAMTPRRRKLLFICAVNVIRSPTAERMFAENDPLYEAKSCGMIKLACKPVSQSLLDWADDVFVMDEWMKDDLLADYNIKDEKIKVLGVKDAYGGATKALVKVLEKRLKEFGIRIDANHVKEAFKDSPADKFYADWLDETWIRKK